MLKLLHVKWTYLHLQLSFLITFVYAFNTREERKSLWEYLLYLQGIVEKAWLILGAFNSVCHDDDRIGGNHVSWTEKVDFAQCIDECGNIH